MQQFSGTKCHPFHLKQLFGRVFATLSLGLLLLFPLLLLPHPLSVWLKSECHIPLLLAIIHRLARVNARILLPRFEYAKGPILGNFQTALIKSSSSLFGLGFLITILH
jgi:hypothetical protein